MGPHHMTTLQRHLRWCGPASSPQARCPRAGQSPRHRTTRRTARTPSPREGQGRGSHEARLITTGAQTAAELRGARTGKDSSTRPTLAPVRESG
eukprot:14911693-Alexandrium_andersonii.AAC.1